MMEIDPRPWLSCTKSETDHYTILTSFGRTWPYVPQMLSIELPSNPPTISTTISLVMNTIILLKDYCSRFLNDPPVPILVPSLICFHITAKGNISKHESDDVAPPTKNTFMASCEDALIQAGLSGLPSLSLIPLEPHGAHCPQSCLPSLAVSSADGPPSFLQCTKYFFSVDPLLMPFPLSPVLVHTAPYISCPSQQSFWS